MLRTTISKIRRVCTAAFLPRALRAARQPSGKFEKFSYAAVCKAQIRSKSDTRDHDDKESKRLFEFAFASNKPPRKRINRFAIEEQPTEELQHKQDSASRVHVNRETECEKCERLIAKVFGIDHDKPSSDHVGETANNLEEIHLQATRKDEETDPDIDAADPEKRANIGRHADTGEPLHTPSRILENIAQVNLASNKHTDYYDKHMKNPEVHTSEVYSKGESNKEIETSTLKATTEKEDEEKLPQRMEHIEETPIEARKPNIVGFNVTPRTLEQNEKVKFSDTTDKADLSAENAEGEKLDELASRCVNAPDNEIDERLLREMESLKSSQPDQTTDNPIYEEDVAKMEMVKEERNVIEQSHNMDLEDREEEKKAADFNILQRLYPTFDGLLSEKDTKQEDISPVMFKPERVYTEEKPLYYEEPTVGFESIEQLKAHTLDEDVVSDRPKVYPNQVLIDPYDKSTLAYDHEESDSTNTYEHVTVKQEPMEHIRVEKEIGKEEEILDEEPQKEQFDPKYVVTCNETCPISAEGLTSTALNTETDCLKGTQAIYDDLASSNLKKQAFKQVAVENEFDEKISESKDEDEVVESEAKPIIETAEAYSQGKEISNSAEEEVMEEKEETKIEPSQEDTVPKEQIAASYPQQDITLNTLDKPNISEDESTDTTEKDLRVAEPIQRNIAANCTIPLPRLNDDQASLSELLKRVRERNRLEYCKAVDIGSTAVEHLGSQAAVVEPEIGKCGKKPPPCPPPAPKCPPPEPCKPPPCPPPQPPCPKPCKPPCPPAQPPCPPKKNPCAKFSTCTGFGIPNLITMFVQPQTFPRLPIPITTLNLNREIIDNKLLNTISIKSVLTDEIILKLQSIGEAFFGRLRARKLRASQSCHFQRTTQRERIAVKDFQPWTPIPSWPIPQKELKRPFVCPKEGCKLVPPPKLNPPCQLNPCINFPKRTFSLAEILLHLFNKNQL